MRAMSLVALMAPLFMVSCDLIEDLKDNAGECVSVCDKVNECGAEPPKAEFGGFSQSSGSGAVDCAANCVQEDRAFYGYSDCQMTCIQEASCDKVQDCWKAKSDTFARFCLDGRETVPVEPEPGEEPENDTNTGSEDADELVKDPATEIAIEEGDFDMNLGDDPPDITGLYHAVGSIDTSENARPPGSGIDTMLCFWGQEKLATGPETNYCEYYVPGQAAAPVTGSGDDFTIYLEYPDVATLLFSGTVDGQGKVAEAETLVVYTYGVDIWEHSNTSWSHEGDCNSCE
jgi:hypothetical protein